MTLTSKSRSIEGWSELLGCNVNKLSWFFSRFLWFEKFVYILTKQFTVQKYLQFDEFFDMISENSNFSRFWGFLLSYNVNKLSRFSWLWFVTIGNKNRESLFTYYKDLQTIFERESQIVMKVDKNSWKFVYILAKQIRSPFSLTNYFYFWF